jgi:hypothetical protein
VAIELGGGVDDPASGFEQQRSRGCERDTERRAYKEVDSGQRFELADLVAERGLGDPQRVCGSPDAAVIGDGDEVDEEAELNDHLKCR